MADPTPGPWLAVRWHNGGWRVLNPAGDDRFGNWLIAADIQREEDARLVAASRDLYRVLAEIKRYGELACVNAEPPFAFPGGKKPASKDVWQFPRHLLNKLDAALAKADEREG